MWLSCCVEEEEVVFRDSQSHTLRSMKRIFLSFFHHFLIVLHLRSPPSGHARIKDGGKRNEEKMKIFGKTSRENENEMKKK